MHPHVQKLIKKYYKVEDHPYRIFTNTTRRYLNSDSTIIDMGCGRNATELKNFNETLHERIGIDVVDFNKKDLQNIRLIKNDIHNISIKDNIADLVISRSVLEHLHNPSGVFCEVFRILKKMVISFL